MVDPLAELKGICTRARFDRVMAAVRTGFQDADRLVVTGDLTHDEQLQTYEILRTLLADWFPRLRVIPGNHDDRNLMRQVFGERIHLLNGRNTFVDTVGAWKLIGMDSHVPGELHGELAPDQLQWLDRELDANPEQPVCLFLHHPPVLVNCPWLDRIALQDAKEFLAILERHSNARLVCCGHIHQERTVIDRTTSICTTPSTGVQFRPETEVLEVDVAPPGFRIIDLHDDGRVQTRVVRVDVAGM